MSVGVYVSHHIQSTDKDTWHLACLKCLCCVLAGENLLLCKVVCAHAVGSGICGGMVFCCTGLLLPQGCHHWENDLIIRKTAALGGLVTALVYLKVIHSVTLLTWLSMPGGMRICRDICCFFPWISTDLILGYKQSPCTLKEHKSALGHTTEG